MSVIDERLVHLRAAGLLQKVKGIVFGQLSIDRSEEDEFENFLMDLVSDLDVPILMDFPAGHEVPNLTLPLGTDVELVADGTTGWLSYKDDALSSAEPLVDSEELPVEDANVVVSHHDGSS
jgi:muramoyltetrapeptide carboxypeptidase LdcA involved in peptidoglycan recycling